MSTLTTTRFDGVSTSATRILGYDIIEKLGVGAGSVIYAATDPATHRIYAIKHVARESEKDLRFVEQLQAEHEVGQNVRHPGLRRTFELKIARNLLRKVTEAALIMEMFDGQPLEIAKPKSVLGMVDVFIKTAEALASLHGMGFVHCDLKPANILLNDAGDVKVIDLGQAVRAGTVKPRIQGTPDYISPEQVALGPVTIRTDVFNFGATMYWTLTGRKLPTLYTVKQAANSFLVDACMDSPAAVNPRVPETLSNLVMECVRTNPLKRPADMNELSRRLEVMQYALRRDAVRSNNRVA